MVDEDATQENRSANRWKDDDFLTISKDPREEMPDSTIPLIHRGLRISGAILWALGWAIGTLLWALGWGVLIGVKIIVTFIKSEDKRDEVFDWFLIAGNRWILIGIGLVSLFSLTVILGVTGYIGLENPQIVSTIFSTGIAGLFAFIPLALSVISLSLSDVFGGSTFNTAYGDFSSLSELRMAISDLSSDPLSLSGPKNLVSYVIDIIEERVFRLLDIVQENPLIDQEVEKELRSIIENNERLIGISNENISFFDLIRLLIDANYRGMAIKMDQIKTRHADVLSEPAEELLEELTEILRYTVILRQYMIDAYFQRALGKLSRYLGISGLMALILSMFVILVFAGQTPDPELGYRFGRRFLVFVALGVTVLFLPFLITVSFGLRIATMVRRSAAPGLFRLEDDPGLSISNISNSQLQKAVNFEDTDEQSDN